MTALNGTVWYVDRNWVIPTLANGEVRDYTVPDSYQFTVEGKPATVSELRKGNFHDANKPVARPRFKLEGQERQGQRRCASRIDEADIRIGRDCQTKR